MENIPTDNLYKFITVLGLIIVTSSGGYFAKVTSEIDDAQELILNEHSKQRSLVNQYAEKLNDLDDQKAKLTSSDHTPEQIGQAEASSDFKKQIALAGFSAELTQSGEKATLHEEELKMDYVARRIAVVGIIIGSIVFFTGLLLWYRNLQVFLDKKIASANNGSDLLGSGCDNESLGKDCKGN